MGFWSGRLEGTNMVVLGMNWRVFEKKKLGLIGGDLGIVLKPKKMRGAIGGF